MNINLIKKLSDQNFKKAFTLAEILITLGIIGVVAAMTIPTLVQQQQKAEYVAKVLKYHSLLNQVARQYMTDNNLSDMTNAAFSHDPGGWNPGASQLVWDTFKPYLKVIKDCGVNTYEGCFSEYYLYLNTSLGQYSGYDGNIDGSNMHGKGVLADGVSFAIVDMPDDCSRSRGTGELLYGCAIITIDVNGPKTPNQYGRDTFNWWVLKNGKVMPAGTPQDGFRGCDPSSTDISDDNTNGAAGLGDGCTAEIVIKKAMNY